MELEKLTEDPHEDTTASVEVAVAATNKKADTASQDLVTLLAAESAAHLNFAAKHVSECETREAREIVLKTQINLTERVCDGLVGQAASFIVDVYERTKTTLGAIDGLNLPEY